MSNPDVERVVMEWPKELKAKVRETAGPRGITGFTTKAVEIHLGVAGGLEENDRELNEVKNLAQQLADQLVLGVSSPEERLQALMEVEFPSWIDTSGWPQSFADRVRPEPLAAEPTPEPTPEADKVVVQEVVEPKLAEPKPVERAVAPEPTAPTQDEEPFVPKMSEGRDDLFARVMAKTGGKLQDVPGLTVASEIPRPEPVEQKDLCPTCGEERIDGECWTC